MILTAKQNDSLKELINIAFARTGASLSELSGHRVILDPPTIGVFPLDELHTHECLQLSLSRS